MTEKERMLAGKLYLAADNELKKDFFKAKKLTRQINMTTEMQISQRVELCRKLFKKVGENIYIEPPFRCDYGCNISIGDNLYVNYDCIIIDVCNVDIGDNVFLAPRVGIYTAVHPIDAEIRNSKLEYGKPIKIGNNVWICANVVINPGVTIGDNVVIGSGSIVTKDVPSNVLAAGNPCRVLRSITNDDKIYWNKLAQDYHNG